MRDIMVAMSILCIQSMCVIYMCKSYKNMIEFSANMENTFTAIIVLIIQILQKQKA